MSVEAEVWHYDGRNANRWQPRLVGDAAAFSLIGEGWESGPYAWADLQAPAPALQVIGRRDVRSNNSWMHNLPMLAKGPERCTLEVHPDDARRLGLADGGTATVQRGEASLQVPVRLSDAVMPGVVSLPHGWGHALPGSRLGIAAERPGANLNALFDGRATDPLSGNAVLAGVAVDVRALN